MAPADEVLSPPYPGDGVTAEGLYNMFRDLRKWVLYYREELNSRLDGLEPTEAIPLPKEIPDRRAYTSQPIIYQFLHLAHLRRIREQWDHLIRVYEDAWDCNSCFMQQVLLVQSAVVAINDAFVPFEVREHQAAQQEVERLQQMFEGLWTMVYGLLQRKPHEPLSQESEE